MPAPLPINWDRCKMLLLQGASLVEICSATGVKLGTLKSRISREKWREEVAESKATVQRLATNEAILTLRERAKMYVDAMAADCETTFARLQHGELPKAGDYDRDLKRENVLEKLNKRARLTYGLDQVGAKSVVVGISVKLGTNLTPQDIDVQAVASPSAELTSPTDTTEDNQSKP